MSAMMKLAEKMPVDESMESRLPPVCLLPSELNIKDVKPREECTEASLVGRGKDEAMARAQKQGCNPTVGRLKMQASDICLENFVIFDHCEGQNTVILHPSWLHGLPHQSSPKPGSMQDVDCFLERLQAFNSNSMDAMFGIHSSAALCPASRLQPALRENVQKCSSIDPVNCKAYTFEKQVLGTSMHSDVEQESLGEFHENTEEINALLSSDDDELSSTGHSPSDGASVGLSGIIYRSGNNIPGKKRKLEDLSGDEVDDADSGSCQPSPGHTRLKSGRYGGFGSFHFLSEGDHKDSPLGVGCGNKLGEISMSSTLHVSRQLIVSEGHHEFKQSSGLFGNGSLMDSSKRIKIKSNVQQLKNAIPGGNLMDTAGVIGRTIHYVKCLQNKLRGLEAARESAKAMHQIG